MDLLQVFCSTSDLLFLAGKESNVKFSMCLIKYWAMKTYGDWRYGSPNS